MANAQRVSDYLYERKRIADHICSLGVDLVDETGGVRFVDAHTIAADDGRTWTADRVIIAAGGRAGRLPIPGAELGLTYEDIRNLSSLPAGSASSEPPTPAASSRRSWPISVVP